MNEQNLSYLKDNVKYMGFGEKLYPALEEQLKIQPAEFSLKADANYLKDTIDATLHFRKSDQSDMYFFNRYDATLTRDNDKDNPLSQTFYVNRGQGITLKEAYNLLDGRAVNKDLTNNEGVKYNAWVQLNFDEKDKNNNYKMSQYHENYGYDLANAVSKLPLKELGNGEQKNALIKSLEKGNVQSVTFEKAGISEKMFIDANPQFKTVNVYDGQMKRVQSQALNEKFGIVREPKPSVNDEQKKDVSKNQEIKPEVKKNLKTDQKQNKTESLLPKKRVSTKKGMSLSK
ncbi:MAG: hypothetical protein ACR2KX_14735 [Chitinophagaceae bacterium]